MSNDRAFRIAYIIGLSSALACALFWLVANSQVNARDVNHPPWLAAASIKHCPAGKNHRMIPKDRMTDTLVLAHWLGWFGLANHRQLTPSYVSTDTVVIRQQVEAAKAMGMDGFIINWYGPVTEPPTPNTPDRRLIDQATRNLFAVVSDDPDFQLAIMYDYNTLIPLPSTARVGQMVSDLKYARDTYFNQSRYSKHNGKPLVFLFANPDVAQDVDLSQVKSAMGAEVSLVYRNPTSEAAILNHVDGFFAWVQAEAWQPDGSDWGEAYLDWFYRSMADPTLPYSQLLTVGAVWPGFNDTLAPWRSGPARFIAQRNDQSWQATWDLAIQHQPSIVQITTWNDWEEQTAVEPDHSLGAWPGMPIDCADSLTGWETLRGSVAISVSPVALVAGQEDGAVNMTYHLSETAQITDDNWVQLKYVLTTSLPISFDTVRFSYQGTTTNSLQIGFASGGANYFSGDVHETTQVPWWTYKAWDLQGIRNGNVAVTDSDRIDAFFVSVKRSDKDDVGGQGSFTVDAPQFLTLQARSVPTASAQITVEPTIAQRAAGWIATQVKQTAQGCLVKSWAEEEADLAWLYDQALALIVFTDTNLDQATCLANQLHALQNADGSWHSGYHYASQPVTSVEPTTPIGANAWTVYALAYYASKIKCFRIYSATCEFDRHFSRSSVSPGDKRNMGVRQVPVKFCAARIVTCFQSFADAQQGARWLATMQRADGSMPDLPGSAGAPTEPNLDAWWSFHATGLHGEADRLKGFILKKLWDEHMGRFKAGPDSFDIFLDNQTWGALFLQKHGQEPNARRALSYAYATLSTCSSNGLTCGLDGGGPYSVWNEGTLQYIVAGGEHSQAYWEQMVKQQAADGGLPGSPDQFRSDAIWLTTMHGVAPSAWLYFAGNKNNPYRPISDTRHIFLPVLMNL